MKNGTKMISALAISMFIALSLTSVMLYNDNSKGPADGPVLGDPADGCTVCDTCGGCLDAVPEGCEHLVCVCLTVRCAACAEPVPFEAVCCAIEACGICGTCGECMRPTEWCGHPGCVCLVMRCMSCDQPTALEAICCEAELTEADATEGRDWLAPSVMIAAFAALLLLLSLMKKREQ